jgi:DNA-binding transcriptional MerR regulator
MLVAIDREECTMDWLARRAGMQPAMIERCVEYGLIEPSARKGKALLFDPAVLPRLRKIGRLRESLGINFAGIAVILDLLDRVRALQRESRRR